MRLAIIAVSALILGLLLHTLVLAQSAPVLTWGVALEGYQIERSFDNVNFKVIAQLPPDALTYTDNTALTEAPVSVTQVCYRIVPLITDGPAFFNDPVCQPFSLIPPISITLVGVASDQVGTTSLTPDGRLDRQLAIFNVTKTITNAKITVSCGTFICSWEGPTSNGTDYLVAVKPRAGTLTVDLFFTNAGKPVGNYTVTLTFSDATTLTLTVQS